MPKKKGKKGKKGGEGKVVVLTTGRILRERARCMCPRFGDAYTRTEKADEIKNEVAFYRIKKCVTKKLDTLDLSGCSIPFVFDELRQVPSLAMTIVDLNLARNQLFNTNNAIWAIDSLESMLINGIQRRHYDIGH